MDNRNNIQNRLVFLRIAHLFCQRDCIGNTNHNRPDFNGHVGSTIWKDNWASWLSRYLSFCLYGFVAYMIMAAAMQLFKYGIQVDIKQLSTPGLPSIFNYNYLYSLVAAVVGGYGLKMTPEIVSWIFPTGTSQAVNAFVNGIQRSTTKAISTGAKATAGAI